MKLSTKSRYGLRAVFDIYYHEEGGPVQIATIARRLGVSPRYLEQIFVQLRRAELMDTRRGPKGGYFMRRPPTGVTVGDVIAATEGPFRLFEPIARPNGTETSTQKKTDALFGRLSDRLVAFLAQTTLKDLLNEAEKAGIEKAHRGAIMYHI